MKRVNLLHISCKGVPSPQLLVEQAQLSSHIPQHVPILLRTSHEIRHHITDFAVGKAYERVVAVTTKGDRQIV